MAADKYERFQLPNLIDPDDPLAALLGLFLGALLAFVFRVRLDVAEIGMIVTGQPAASLATGAGRVSLGRLTKQQMGEPGCKAVLPTPSGPVSNMA